jgi:hypothetical protein
MKMSRRMRTARVVLSTVACAPGSRQFQALSKAILMSLTVSGLKWAAFATSHLSWLMAAIQA